MALDKTGETDSPHIVAFAGGVGGAKLAHGLAEVLPPGHLTVVVNTGDDFTHYALHISPDIDTVMYTLAGIANPATGWGIVDESWQMLTMMDRYNEQSWFRLGDRDLATHLIRTEALHQGQTLTEVTTRLSQALNITQHLLPATDDVLATIVHTKSEGVLPFQEYFVRHRWQPVVNRLEYRGAETARTSSAVTTAMQNADAFVICPSNPVLSLAPVLAVSDIRQKLENREVPCLAVSPLINGQAVKGPTDKIMKELNMEPSTAGIVTFYDGLIDKLVIDESDGHTLERVTENFPDLSIYQTRTLMKTFEDRKKLAASVLRWLD